MESTEKQKLKRSIRVALYVVVVLAIIGVLFGVVFLFKELGLDRSTQPTRVKQGDNFYQTAKAYYAVGEYARALGVLKHSISPKADADLAYKGSLLMGAIYDSMGEYSKAVSVYKSLLADSRKDEHLYYNLAVTYEHMDNLYDATSSYERALAINSKFEEALVALGNIYYRKHAYNLALGFYRRVLEQNRYNKRVLLKVGLIYYKRGEIQNSVEILKKAAESVDRNVSSKAYAALGTIYAENSMDALAEQMYIKSLAADSKQSAVLYNLALIYIRMGNYERASGFLKDALEKNPEDETILEALGNVYYQSEEYDKSLAYYKTIENLYGQNYTLLGVLADLYYKQGELIEAARYYKKILILGRRDSAFYNAIINLGNINDDLGKTETAFQYYNTALQEESLPNTLKATLYYNIGLLYLRNGVGQEAIEALKKAYSLNKTDSMPLKRIAQYYASNNRPEYLSMAIATYHEIERNFPNDNEALFNLGSLYYKAGKLDKAKRYFDYLSRSALSKDRQAEAFANLGLIYSEMNEEEKARESFLKALDLSPSTPLYAYNLGMLFYNTSRYEAAIEQFRRALVFRHSLTSDLASTIYLALGNAHYKLGYYQKAEELFKKALEYNSANAEASYNLSVVKKRNSLLQ